MTESQGHLAHNLVVFGHLLRTLGLPIQPSSVRDFSRALGWIGVERRDEVYHAARALFVLRKEDLAIFDEAFERFWRSHTESQEQVPPKPRGRDRPQASLGQSSGPDKTFLLRDQSENPGESDDELGSVQHSLTYSPDEVLRHKDFGELSDTETAKIRRLLANLTWSLGMRRSRRWRPGKLRLVDFRRTFRESLRNDGELLRLARRRHKMRPRPLVVLADISGSMERYTSLLLYFVVGLARSLEQPVEAFLFGTRLTRVTREIHRRGSEQVLREISRAVPDWSGGTRIGQALKTFNYDWARRVLGRRAVVLMISDGWDRGDIGLLRHEMARLQRSCSRLIWLNPLLGSAEYEPLTRGIQAALPYVDDFLPVHDLASLEQLAVHLQRLEDVRPMRRQQRPKLDLHSTEREHS